MSCLDVGKSNGSTFFSSLKSNIYFFWQIAFLSYYLRIKLSSSFSVKGFLANKLLQKHTWQNSMDEFDCTQKKKSNLRIGFYNPDNIRFLVVQTNRRTLAFGLGYQYWLWSHQIIFLEYTVMFLFETHLNLLLLMLLNWIRIIRCPWLYKYT